MANRKPLVLVAGEQQQLQSGDSLVDGAGNPISGAIISTVVAKSANFTVATSDKSTLYLVTTAGSTITATLPAAATAGAGWSIMLQKADTGAGVLATSPAVLDVALLALMEQYDAVLIWTDGTNYYANSMPSSFDAQTSDTPIMFAIASLKL